MVLHTLPVGAQPIETQRPRSAPSLLSDASLLVYHSVSFANPGEAEVNEDVKNVIFRTGPLPAVVLGISQLRMVAEPLSSTRRTVAIRPSYPASSKQANLAMHPLSCHASKLGIVISRLQHA